MVESQNISEAEISAFFQSHSELLTKGLGTGPEAVAHVRLGSRNIADFLLGPRGSGPWVIVELDSPNYKVSVSRGANAKLSTAVLKGAATLREFANLFGDAQFRRAFAGESGIDVYRPKLALVIGRDFGELSREDMIELKSTLADIELLTYRDLLERMRSNS